MASRAAIILFTVWMYIVMIRQVQFKFDEIKYFALVTRIVLLFNVFYSLDAISTNLTLVWEQASVFVDLISEVLVALIPFAVFLIMYLFTFFLSIYMFGQHQVGFDYFHPENQEDIIEGILQDCNGENYDDCDER